MKFWQDLSNSARIFLVIAGLSLAVSIISLFICSEVQMLYRPILIEISFYSFLTFGTSGCISCIFLVLKDYIPAEKNKGRKILKGIRIALMVILPIVLLMMIANIVIGVLDIVPALELLVINFSVIIPVLVFLLYFFFIDNFVIRHREKQAGNV